MEGFYLDDLRIKLENIGKEFSTVGGPVVVIDGISFAVKDKEFVTIMGPSGCGKSILLKILGGVLKPTRGSIFLAGKKYSAGLPKDEKKNIGLIFQTHNLLPWRSVRKNLMLPLEVLKLKGEKWENRVDELLEMVGLADFRDAYPYELSGGMQQRIGMIRGMVHDPGLLLMDQPFGALDAITRKQLSYELLDIWAKTKKTVLMITNDIDEALLLSSKILIMSPAPGKIVQELVVDLPLEIRNLQIRKNERYIRLRDTLKQLVRAGQDMAGVNLSEKKGL
jgi:NitT/TauT family transport system ATP-binding protein